MGVCLAPETSWQSEHRCWWSYGRSRHKRQCLVVLGVYYMSKWRWRSSKGHIGGLRVGVDGPRNRLEVSLVVLVVILTY